MPKPFLFFVLICSALRLWLVSDLPVIPFAGRHDDFLFLSLGERFALWLNGKESFWLGPYHSLTLAKGPGYPIWLGLVFLSGTPIHIADFLLYLFSGLILILALKKIMPGKLWPFIFFALYAFNPFVHSFELRQLRDNIYPALCVLVLACFAGIYAYRKDRLTPLFLWAISAGISLAAFWITREESAWILPGIILITGATLISLWRSRRNLNFRSRFFTAVLLPFAVFLLSLHMIASLNLRHYGVYAITDSTTPLQSTVYGTISRIRKPAGSNPYVPAPKEVREKIYAVSPAFEELRPTLESGHWQKNGPALYFSENEPRDILGGWILWAIRDAVDESGHYGSPQKAAAHYEKIIREINTACADGRLDCLPLRKTILPQFTLSDLDPLISVFCLGLKKIVFLEDVQKISQSSVSFQRSEPPFHLETATARLLKKMTHTRIAPVSNDVQEFFNRDPELRELFGSVTTAQEKLKMRVFLSIAEMYRKFLPALFCAAFFVFIIRIVKNALQKEFPSFPIVFAAALLSIFTARLAIFTLVHTTFFPILSGPSYLRTFYPLLLIFLVVVLNEAFNYVFLKKKRLQNSGVNEKGNL